MSEITLIRKGIHYRIYTSKGELMGDFSMGEIKSYLFKQPKQAGFYHIEPNDEIKNHNS